MRSCVVVGAGMAGLLATPRLTAAGIEVTTLDQSPRPGGRLATVRQPDAEAGVAVWDVGAQFITARDPAFVGVVDAWREAGAVDVWFRGLPPPDPPEERDDPHYHGVGGMDALAAHVASAVAVRCGVRVLAARRDTSWVVKTSAGQRLEADALLLAVPVDHARLILDGVRLRPDVVDALAAIDYIPTLAVLARLEGPSGLPPPGAWHGDGDPIAWIGDNARKGISPAPTVTIHASGPFSEEYLDAPEDEWVPPLLAAAAEVIGTAVRSWTAHRWPQATPDPTHPERTIVDDNGPVVAFAGDAFAGPRVEGAALSGLAAAGELLSRARDGP